MAVLSAERLRERAQRWLAAEIERSQRAHGARWPEHRAWIMDYLRCELRARLARFQKVREGAHGQA